MKPKVISGVFLLSLAACGGQTPPPAVDAEPQQDAPPPPIDAPEVDAPPVDAPVADASPDASCQCRDGFDASQISAMSFQQFMSAPGLAITDNCGIFGAPLGHSCAVSSPPRPGEFIISDGFDIDFSGDFSICQARKDFGVSAMSQLTISRICVRRDVSPPPDPSCGCPTVPRVEDRLQIVRETATAAEFSSLTLNVSCGDDAVLINGGCSVSLNTPVAIPISYHGPSDQDPNAWRCTWNNNTSSAVEVGAQAVCLARLTDPTIPDTLANRIVRVSATQTIPGESSAIIPVGCGPDDALLTGGCKLDSPADPGPQVTLFHNSFEGATRTSARWACGWHNLSTEDATATVVATCLQPL